jgi:hypothetical protein
MLSLLLRVSRREIVSARATPSGWRDHSYQLLPLTMLARSEPAMTAVTIAVTDDPTDDVVLLDAAVGHLEVGVPLSVASAQPVRRLRVVASRRRARVLLPTCSSPGGANWRSAPIAAGLSDAKTQPAQTARWRS